MKLLRIISLIAGLFLFSTLCVSAAEEGSEVSWSAKVEHTGGEDYRVVLSAEIGEGWHMYDLGPYEGGPNPVRFSFNTTIGLELEGEITPTNKPIRKYDDIFDMEIGSYQNSAEFEQRLKLSAPGGILDVNIEWMVCDDVSCIPPTDKDIRLTIGDAALAETATPRTETIAGSDFSRAQIVTGSLWSTMLAAMAWALLALLTPCVFPMIPMTVSYFMSRGRSVAQGRFSAAMYGLFIVLLYTVPIAGLILITRIVGGETVTADIFNWLSTHWLPNVIFFLVFMIFAASFFGAFEITMPSWLVNKSDRKADKKGLGGVFFMALTLVLVSFSCTGPLIGNALIESTSGGSFWSPILTMLAFSVVFALPFTFFALFPSLLDKLPKSGGWLNSIKVCLGFVEVALGLKFLSIADQTYHWGILDREIYLAIWIVVFSLMGVYLMGKIKFLHDSDVKHIGVGRLTLIIMTFSFVVYLVPGMFGAPLKGLSGYLPPMHTQDFVMGQGSSKSDVEARSVNAKYSDFLHLPHGLDGFFDLEQAQEYADQVGKPLFVDITGHGCVNCREMEARVWSDPQVLEMLRRDYVLVALYLDDKTVLPKSDWYTTDKGKVLKGLGKINSHKVFKTYGVNAQPYYVLQGRGGRILVQPMGYNLSVPDFVAFLKSGLEAYDLER